VLGLLRDAGLEIRIDAAGNIFGRREGREAVPALLIGSHIDSVPHGGNYDGDVGSLGAIEVARLLASSGTTMRHPLEVVIWSDEEGGRYYLGSFGSDAAAGQLPAGIADRRDAECVPLSDWLRQMGGDPETLAGARIPRGRYAGYLELHIEQGAVMERAGVPIGVVQGIVGISSRTCTAQGFANHAGTTPMDQRKDALAAAARAVLAVREEVRAEPTGHPVGTVGWLEAKPGAVNVIPGTVNFTIEIRDLDEARIARIDARIQSRLKAIGADESVDLHCALPEVSTAAVTDPVFRKAIGDAAKAAGLRSMELPSGAGHDAQNVATFAPMGMIFVPSIGGISHSPKEYTPPDAIAQGTDVLGRALLELDESL
jgi:N-carbamoyl-L-amino-acid hydrolase